MGVGCGVFMFSSVYRLIRNDCDVDSFEVVIFCYLVMNVLVM